MNYTYKLWLEQLYQNEIKEVEKMIAAEHIWTLGSDMEEEIEMHYDNEQELLAYKELLLDLIKELN